MKFQEIKHKIKGVNILLHIVCGLLTSGSPGVVGGKVGVKMWISRPRF